MKSAVFILAVTESITLLVEPLDEGVHVATRARHRFTRNAFRVRPVFGLPHLAAELTQFVPDALAIAVKLAFEKGCHESWIIDGPR